METRHKVLVVDDEPAVLELYRDLLSQLPSKPEIFVTASGARALAMLKAEPFRLLVCDLKMPKMDGLQVLSIVRRSFPELRTVVLTGVQDEEFRSRAYALGVDLFWFKPDTQQNMQMFLECVESLLGRDNDTGFRGVQSKSLLDLIQMECLSQSSTMLRVTRGSQVGRIWIQSGELIDAEMEDVTGEAAFRKILEWKSGTFENLPPEPGRPRTITKPVNALLLESAQAMDEDASPQESAKEDAKRQGARYLGKLSSAGADFLVCLPSTGKPEGWGTEATEELAGWLRVAGDAGHRISHALNAGPLQSAEGRGVDHRIVVIAEQARSWLVGWPLKEKEAGLTDESKQMIASWDS
jgi:CheY-like chemotaxis protein